MQIVGNVLSLNGVTNEEEFAVTELLRDVERADRGDQNHRDAGNDAWHAEREYDAAEHGNAAASEIAGGLEKPYVQFGKNGVDRQNHVRKVIVHHAENDGGLRADYVYRSEADLREEAVNDTRVLEKRHPRVRADEEVHPHGDHDERYHRLLRSFLGARHNVRDRIAENETDCRGNNGKLQRAHEDKDIGANLFTRAVFAYDVAFGGEKTRDVVCRECKVIVCKRVKRDKDQRNYDEQKRPHGIRRERRTVGGGRLCPGEASSTRTCG